MFKSIIGRESSPHNKESGEPTKLALKELNANPKTTLMIGDAPMDYTSAKNAGIDNIILLCERSHHIQDDQTTQEDYLRLYDIKQKQHRQRKAKESISEINIEPEIDQVLEGLRNVKLDELVELKMIPVEVKQKVSDHILQTKILLLEKC